MISVGGIVLDDNITLAGLINEPKLSGTITATFGGVAYRNIARSVGQSLVLEVDRGHGYVTYTQSLSLAELRDAGSAVAVVHPMFSGNAIIPPDGINLIFTDFDKCVNPTGDEWMDGTINLITV